ncbi:uncharacterized protein CBL_13029 [Carabus blaptoides fortunei]
MSLYGFVVQDLIAKGRMKHEDMIVLKEWLQNQDDMPKFTDETMALFFLACKNHVENTKKCARNYYLAAKDGPELFNDRDITRIDIQSQLKILNFCVMPQRTDEGYVVTLHRLVDYEASLYHMDVAMKVLFMTMDTSLYDDPPTGIITLFDMKGVGLKHLTRIKLGAMKKFFFYVQEALPLQLRAIHVLNIVWFFDKIFKLVKPFIKPEVIEQLYLHTSSVNMDEFYNKCIPKKCLPSDYGGDLDSVRELQKITDKKLVEMQEYFVKEQMIRTI